MDKYLLLIDDDEEEMLIFSEAIKALKLDFNCLYANGAIKALEIVGTYYLEMIFVDLNMPRINGLDCIKQLRNILVLKQKPIILYSTFISYKDEKQAYLNGVSGCVQKPKTFTELKNLLDLLIQQYILKSLN